MRYPTDNNRITSEFGWRKIGSRLDFHNGIDYGCLDNRNPTNDPIYCVTDGTVVRMNNDVNGFGKYAVVEHQGYCSLYAHMDEYKVSVGDKLVEGDIIGLMGTTGNSTGIHLHFEIREVPYSKFWTRWRDLVPNSDSSEPVYTVDPEKVFLENTIDNTGGYDSLIASNKSLIKKLNEIYK